jgi:glycosyltransferase involved in cell wall biosynthesis
MPLEPPAALVAARSVARELTAAQQRMGGEHRPRVLVATTWFPFPADNGIRQRQWALLDGLRERFDVDLVALCDEPVTAEALDAVRERCERVEVVLGRPFERRSPRALAAYLHPLPRAVVATRTPAMEQTVGRLVAERGYAAAIAVEVHVAQYLRPFRHLPRVLEDVELTGLRETSESGGRFGRLRDALSWWKVQRYMRVLLTEFDLTTAVSEEERDVARQLLPAARVVVVPNGVHARDTADHATAPVPGSMIYAGSPTFVLNREAVEWFAEHVLPLVAAVVPSCRLRVTGRNDGVVDALPRGPHIEYTGYLEDIAGAIASSAVSVVPLRRGGGTRLKVLESLALGTPVVSTTKGVEGLDLIPGREVIVADTAEDFAAALLDLFADPGRRESLVSAGRVAVSERYDWQPIAARFTDLVGDVAKRAATPF